ncbi:MAG: hypothetical protein V5A57_00540 [Candidatus Paceibacterota bacterium]
MNNKRLEKTIDFLTDLLFPKFCINCGKEGAYLCQDCRALMNISEHQYCLCEKPKVTSTGKCTQCQNKSLDGLYFAVSPQDQILQKILYEYRQNSVKDLSETLASLIITHLRLLDNPQPWEDKKLITVPTPKDKIKKQGFDPTLKIAESLSEQLQLPLIESALKTDFKIKKKVKGKKLLLAGITYENNEMNQWAELLKQNQAKEVWGITVTRTK